MAEKSGNPSKTPKPKKDPEGLHEGHRERLKRRFREADSFDGFEEHQILELLLFYSIPRIDTNEIAHVLLNRFGSLAGVFDADYDELIKMKYITENTATLLKMIPKFINVYYKAKNKDTIYNDNKLLRDLFKARLAGLDHEELWVACFNNKLELITCELVCSGSVNGATINMRKLMEIVLKSNAVSVAIAHNHPQGDPKPSNDDIATTRAVKSRVEGISAQLLDHIIVGESDTVSLRFSSYMFWD